MIRLFPLLVVLLLVTCLSGCNKDGGLQGKWTFDRDYTQSQVPKEQPTPTPASTPSMADMANAMKPALASMLVPMLIEKLDGVNLTITSKELMYTLKDGTGQSQPYEVVDQPAANSWRIKTSDGKIDIYSREGDRLVTPASGDITVKLYFKPAGK